MNIHKSEKRMCELIAIIIREKRIALGLSARKTYINLGISLSTYSKIESGDFTSTSFAYILRILLYLDIDFKVLGDILRNDSDLEKIIFSKSD